MQLQTHILGAAAIGIAFAPNVGEMLACMMGGLAPDKLDSIFSFRSRRRWERIHRTWSHNLGWWLIPVIAWIAFWPYHPQGIGKIAYGLAFYFYAGLLSHLLLDALNPTGIGIVPFLSRQRVGAGIVRTGSGADRALGAVLLFLAVIWRAHAGFDFRTFFFFGAW